MMTMWIDWKENMNQIKKKPKKEELWRILGFTLKKY